MENMPQEESRERFAGQAYRGSNPYILPASILIAALIIGGSIIYLVNSGSGGANVKNSGQAVNPLTLPYEGPQTAFVECVDSGRHVATVQADRSAASAAGINSTPTTFINGNKITDVNGNSVGANTQAILDAIEKAVQDPTLVPKPTEGPFALAVRDVILGRPDAPITIIEYGDYQCPFCELFHAEVSPLIDANYIQTGKANFVFRDFAFLGQESISAGAAAECAKDSGRFWEYHDALYSAKTEDANVYGGGENDGFLSRDTLLNIGQKAGL